MSTFTAATQHRPSPRAEKQWHEHNECIRSIQLVTSDATSRSRGSAVYQAHRAGSINPPLPYSLLNPVFFFSSLVLGSRKNWKSGSAWKWHHQQKEMDTVKVSKHERERENTVKCSVIVMQPPLKYPPSPPLWESAQPGPLLSFLPAAGQNYDVIGCNVSDRSDESSTKQNSERNFTVKPFWGGIKLEVV